MRYIFTAKNITKIIVICYAFYISCKFFYETLKSNSIEMATGYIIGLICMIAFFAEIKCVDMFYKEISKWMTARKMEKDSTAEENKKYPR